MADILRVTWQQGRQVHAKDYPDNAAGRQAVRQATAELRARGKDCVAVEKLTRH